jgi:RNA polymerase sporulation-specific sigma factor
MKLYEDMDLKQLITACRDHDDLAFDQLVHRYTPMMRKVISAYTSPTHEYEELFCEACVALHNAVQRYDLDQQDVTFGLYARICVRNRIVDQLRTADQLPDVVECDVEQVSVTDGVLSRLLERESFESLLKYCHDILSDYEFRVLLLHIQGYKTAAIAKMLSRSAKSVDNAKSRIFRRLRNDSERLRED